MQIARHIGIALVWFAGLALTFAAINKNDPYLIALRGAGNVVLVAASIAVLVMLLRGGYWSRRGVGGRLLVLLWCLPALAMLGAHLSFEVRKQQVLRADPAQTRMLGSHFIVGYSSFDEVAMLAERGLIAGVYITKRNIDGKTPDAMRSEIAGLQERRRVVGLPPLIIAADQEGGIVSHLSPPLTKLPALASLTDLATDDRKAKAEEFGRIHGHELAGLGVSVNFAPVLDLRIEAEHNPLDFHTLIGQRAISNDPALVSEIATSYIRGLEASGIGATVKHFPGLGRVRSDTHHFNADLETPLVELESSDWRPFRDVLTATSAHLMVGHVTLTALDPDRPASHSKKIIDGVIRMQWNYRGVVVTDDLVMGAIYQNNVCVAVVEALNAGVDLLLVAYDGAQFYRIFACALNASGENKLDAAMLQASKARLNRVLTAD